MSDTANIESEDWVAKPLPVPHHWSLVDFEEAFFIVSTNGIKTPEKEYQDRGAFPIVDQGREQIGGYTDLRERVINRDGSVIVFGDHTRCFKLITFPFAPGADGTKVLRPCEEVLPKFAYYGCLTLSLPNRGYSRHYSFLRSSKFPIAPLGEQRRIVAKIEELFSELDKGVEALTTAREQLAIFRLVALHESVCSSDGSLYPSVPLDSLIGPIEQGWSPKCDLNRTPDAGEWAIIKTTVVQPMSYLPDECKPLPTGLTPRPDIEIHDGDILMTRKGPRIRTGVVCFIKSARPRSMLCDTVYRFRANEQRIDPEYLALALNSPHVVQAIDRKKSGISESGISLNHARVRSVQIPVPPSKELQRRLVLSAQQRLSQVEHTQALIDEELQRVAALRQSILKQAFSGQLVAQDPADEPASVLLQRIRAERAKAGTNKASRKMPERKTRKAKQAKESVA